MGALQEGADCVVFAAWVPWVIAFCDLLLFVVPLPIASTLFGAVDLWSTTQCSYSSGLAGSPYFPLFGIDP